MLDWSMVFSLITAATAIIALVLTSQQIRQSNKQALFEKRIALWTVTQGLQQLFEKHQIHFENKDAGPFLSNDFTFTWLTNNAYLSEVSSTLDHVLEQPFQLIFLRKLEELRGFSTSSKLIFRGKESLYIGAFLYDYQALLFAMYQYQILINHMQEDSKRFQWSLEKAVDHLDEPNQRSHLFSKYEALRLSYDKLTQQNIQRKIERQIRLT